MSNSESEDSIEKVITYYQQALEVYTRRDSPIEWATITNNLGRAYADRVRGNREQNLEEAINCYQQALLVHTQGDFPSDWGNAINNLGVAYLYRTQGERADNIERAIDYFHQALLVRTRETMPVEWAKTMMNLGNACQHRVRGHPANNLEEADLAYTMATQVITRETMPVDWAGIMNNRGALQLVRSRGNWLDGTNKYIEHAINDFQQALQIRKRQTMPIKWAETMHNLGDAYLERSQRQQEGSLDGLREAIDCFRQVLDIHTQQNMPIEWATTMYNLGNAYYLAHKHSNQVDDLEQSIDCYRQSLLVRTRQALPADNRMTLQQLGNLYFDQQQWEKAQTTYSEAIETDADLLLSAYTELGRWTVVGESSTLYARAAYSLLQTGRTSDALVQLEKGKTRLLTQTLLLSEEYLQSLSEMLRKSLQQMSKTIQDLEAEYRLTPNTPPRRSSRELSSLLEQIRAEMNDLIKEIRDQNPSFMPVALDLAGILALIPEDAALVAPVFTLQGGAIFVVPHGVKTVTEESVIRLDNFTTEDLNTLLPVYEAGSFEDWRAAVEKLTSRLWEALLSPIHTRLTAIGVKQVIFMPQSGLGLLPLHAAWRVENGHKRYFLDDYEVSYTPSAYALDAARHRLNKRKGQSALVAGVSESHKLGNLPNVRLEVTAIAECFKTKRLLNGSATRASILDGASGKTYIHLACHGKFAWANPLASALYLANDEPLTLSDIMSKLYLDSAPLVVLSACETGISDVSQLPDEFVGLPAGFMQAGAAGVVSSLWEVDDQSTSLLMQLFYTNILEGNMKPTIALREAQIRLRDATRIELGESYKELIAKGIPGALDAYKEIMFGKPDDKPYCDPYHWAAFTFSGV